MSVVEKFHDGIRQLEEQLVALATLTDRPSPPADDILVAARWTIVRTLAEIAAFREKFLFVPMEASGNAGLVAQSKTMIDVMHTAMRALIAHSERWPPLAVRADWLGYRAAQRDAHRVMRDYFAWEIRLVPSLFDALEGASGAPKRNWTRPIWALHDALKPG